MISNCSWSLHCRLLSSLNHLLSILFRCENTWQQENFPHRPKTRFWTKKKDESEKCQWQTVFSSSKSCPIWLANVGSWFYCNHQYENRLFFLFSFMFMQASSLFCCLNIRIDILVHHDFSLPFLVLATAKQTLIFSPRY